MKKWTLSVITDSNLLLQIQEFLNQFSLGLATRQSIPFGKLVATTWVLDGEPEKVATAKEAICKMLFHTTLHTGLRTGVEFVRHTEG
jgi:hypothetical protein